MKRIHRPPRPLRPIACAWLPVALLGCSPVLAQPAPDAPAAPTPDEVRRDLYTLENTAGVGLGWVSADNRRYGQYRGWTHRGSNALLDLSLIRRDEPTGTWLKLKARSENTENREFSLLSERQGAWGWWVQGTQFTRREPLVVNSGLQGLGTGTQIVSASAPKRDLDLKVGHDILNAGLRSFVLGKVELVATLRQDEGRGDRMMGRGTSNVMEFLTEPIDRVTRSWSVLANYRGSGAQFSGGYSGSSYDNKIPLLRSSGGNTASFGSSWDMALPPSNSAQQLHLAGSLNWGDSTRSSFKLSRGIARQEQTFDPVLPRLAGTPDNLQGRVVTTLVYADISARPARAIELLGSWRHEDRDDQTPATRFLAEVPATVGGNFGTAGVSGLVKPRSLKQDKGLLEAGWRLDGGYRLSAAVEQETLHRQASPLYRRVAFRARTDETTARVDFKRTMSETVNGSISLLSSRRGGSDYVPDTYDPNALTNQVGAMMWSDRQREKLRLAGDWLPDERWSLQFIADASRDSYSGRPMGLLDGAAHFVSVDANFRFNDDWNATAWASREATHSRQVTRADRVGAVSAGYDTVWQAAIGVDTQALGFSLRGRARPGLNVGLDLSASQDSTHHEPTQIGGSGTAVLPTLPPFYYRQRTAKLFADLALQPKASLRFEVGYDKRSNNDWTWQGWTYNGAPAVAAAARTSDGTTVTNLPREEIFFAAISYRIRWR